MNIPTRAEARAHGIKRYFTDKPCIHGHKAERLTSNGSCCECFSIRQKRLYHANIEDERLKQKLRRDSDPLTNQKKRARRIAQDPGYEARANAWHNANGARKSARTAGFSQYSTGVPCKNGHQSPRYVTDGKCVECNRMACAARNERRVQSSPALLEFRRTKAERSLAAAHRNAEYVESVRPWREASAAREAAVQGGAKTYEGKPCKRGHGKLRYTISGGCIGCAAEQSASAKKKQYDVQYGLTNRDRIKKQHREYAARTAPARLAAARKWAADNPSKSKAIKKSYKARRRAKEADGDSTAVIHTWESAAPKVCHWCNVKCPKKYHVDHYVPLSKGGRHAVSNLVISCPKCNLTKNAKDPYEFAASVGRLF